MTRTHRRKPKNIIAEIIANLLIAIAILIKCLIPATILILIIVSLHITYEQFRQAMIAISLIGTVTAVIILLRKNERGEKNGRSKSKIRDIKRRLS